MKKVIIFILILPFLALAHTPRTKFYFAGSSEMFGKVRKIPQNELTPFHPRSTYGISKVAGFDLTRHYREAFNLFCCSGILFNHESPRRGFEFVTRKISLAVARIKNNLQKNLKLGNIKAKRDWGHAKDYVKAMWLMLQRDEPDDYVVCTGKSFTIEDFLDEAFSYAGIEDWKKYVVIDKDLYRPCEVDYLRGDNAKAKKVLGWKPECDLEELVKLMMDAKL